MHEVEHARSGAYAWNLEQPSTHTMDTANPLLPHFCTLTDASLLCTPHPSEFASTPAPCTSMPRCLHPRTGLQSCATVSATGGVADGRFPLTCRGPIANWRGMISLGWRGMISLGGCLTPTTYWTCSGSLSLSVGSIVAWCGSIVATAGCLGLAAL